VIKNLFSFPKYNIINTCIGQISYGSLNSVNDLAVIKQAATVFNREAMKKNEEPAGFYKSYFRYTDDIVKYKANVAKCTNPNCQQFLNVDKFNTVQAIRHICDSPLSGTMILVCKNCGWEAVNTIKGFRGSVWSDYLIVDWDGEDLYKLKNDLVYQLDAFINFYQIDEYQIYFSGNKGFHFYTPSKYFGLKPGNDLPNQMKDIAGKFFGGCDMAIYNHIRYIREPDSLHTKSGLYKIPLTFDELDKYSINDIKCLAKRIRYEFYS